MASERKETTSDRREFLRSCGSFAAVTPPAVTFLLSTSMSSKAIAASGGNGTLVRGGDGGPGMVALAPLPLVAAAPKAPAPVAAAPAPLAAAPPPPPEELPVPPTPPPPAPSAERG